MMQTSKWSKTSKEVVLLNTSKSAQKTLQVALPVHSLQMQKRETSTFVTEGEFDVSMGGELTDCTMEYLADLLREKKMLSVFAQAVPIVDRLVDNEVMRVRMALFKFQFSIGDLDLPEPAGNIITVQEKVFIPVQEHPDYNFVGRILGPRGMTAKQLEHETGCRIMVRGQGSLRDFRKEALNRGKPNWEHLEEDLHVLVQCVDTPNRAYTKLEAATAAIKKLLVPVPDGVDDLKRKQLTELAIINGTYRARPRYPLQSGTPMLAPLTFVSPLAPSGTLFASRPLLMSPLSSPIVHGQSIVSTSTLGPYGQSSTIDYNNIFMNQQSVESALASFSGELPTQSSLLSSMNQISSGFAVPTPSVSAHDFFITPITPPPSAGSFAR